ICGGYQLLGERIEDDVESKRGAVDGLGLLPVTTRFEADKVLTRPSATCAWLDDAPVSGYEIRHGRPVRHGGEPLFGADEGCRSGWTLGTSWHGALEGDDLRRALLRRVATVRGRRFTGGGEPFATIRERRLDRLGDLIAQHADTAALTALIDNGAPTDLPTLGSSLEAPCSA
ncbi:MAG: hypothetical protein JHC95_21010, partial [Solirubrobacteraceae bacterium]|nr:hypothetical protein [Solirubrobacteraceae bacterium]